MLKRNDINDKPTSSKIGNAEIPRSISFELNSFKLLQTPSNKYPVKVSSFTTSYLDDASPS